MVVKQSLRRLLVAGVAVPLALLAAGCSDDDGSSGAGAADRSSEGAAEEGAGAGDATAGTGEGEQAATDMSGKTMGTPPSGDTADLNIAQIAAGTPETQTLTRLVLQAGLLPVVRDGGPFTVFAPVDAAFAELPAGALAALSADTPQLTTVLTGHVVPGTYTADDLVAMDGQTLETAAGTRLLVEVSGDEIQVGGATIAVEDITASNGVVHAIGSVILEPNG